MQSLVRNTERVFNLLTKSRRLKYLSIVCMSDILFSNYLSFETVPIFLKNMHNLFSVHLERNQKTEKLCLEFEVNLDNVRIP